MILKFLAKYVLIEYEIISFFVFSFVLLDHESW